MVTENENINEEGVAYWRKELYASLYRYMTVTMFKWFVKAQPSPKKFVEEFLLNWRKIALTKQVQEFQKEKLIGDVIGFEPSPTQRKEYMKAFNEVVSTMDEIFEGILNEPSEDLPR